MSWKNYGYFYRNLELLDMGFGNFVTTRKTGNMKKVDELENIVVGEQTHSTNFYEITTQNKDSKYILNNDGFMTRLSDIWMGVFTADCMPIFVVSPKQKHKIAGVLHSGWKGLHDGITEKAIQYFGVDMADIFVFVGPHINRECYEVSADFKERFVVDEILKNGEKKYFLDMQKNLAMHLEKIGFPKNNLRKTELCTICNNDDFYSYRQDGQTNDRILSGLKISGENK